MIMIVIILLLLFDLLENKFERGRLNVPHCFSTRDSFCSNVWEQAARFCFLFNCTLFPTSFASVGIESLSERCLYSSLIVKAQKIS